MPTSTKSKTRQRAEARRAALKEELAQVAIVIKVDQRREQEQRRQLRNRQDRIIGAWFRSRQTGPQQHTEMTAALDAYLTDDHDRAAFDLAPLPPATPDPETEK